MRFQSFIVVKIVIFGQVVDDGEHSGIVDFCVDS